LYLREAELGEPMPFRLREYFMKKYSRHRGVPKFALDAIDADLEMQEAVCLERKSRSGTDHNEKRLRAVKRLKVQTAEFKTAAHRAAVNRALQMPIGERGYAEC
jgi:hypothetical protein